MRIVCILAHRLGCSPLTTKPITWLGQNSPDDQVSNNVHMLFLIKGIVYSQEVNVMFKHFLVLLDGSPLAECVLPHTIAFTRAFNPEVTLLRVVADPHPTLPIDLFDWQLRKAEAEAYLDTVAMQLGAAGVPAEPVVIEGEPAGSVITYLYQHPIDLLLLSSHGEGGLTGWNIGSVAQKILLRAPVSTLLVRACQPIWATQTDLRYRRLLTPLDGSPRANYVLPFATALARADDAELLLVHVVRQPDLICPMPPSLADRALAAALTERNRAAIMNYFEQVKRQSPVAIKTRLVVSDDVAATLHTLAITEQVDLVILSAHGYSGATQWPYGSIAANFIAYGATPLLLIQDLTPVGRQPTMAEVVAQESGHLYRAAERFLS